MGKMLLKKCCTFLGASLLVLFFAIVGKQGLLEVYAQEVSLVKGEEVGYMGYSTHYYYVDGKLAFCLQPSAGTPEDGTYASSEISPDDLLAKAMYYVYGGPGFEAYMKPELNGGWESPDLAYCLSHCILSYIYDGCNADSDAFLGLNEDIRNAVVQFTAAIRTWPEIPEADVSLSTSNTTAYFDLYGKCQRTEVITCSGSDGVSLNIPLPAWVSLVNVDDGSRQTGTVVVKSGDQFYLEADVSYGNGGAWESGVLQGNAIDSWRTLVVKPGGGDQDVGTGEVIQVTPAASGLQVSWLPEPELAVEKSADKTGKIYEVGDLIAYTVDVTQQIERAVAKNVTISDTIITEGVKLQKNSVVLLDENQSVIADADITVKGNTYTIHAGEFLQGPESGEKYTVEYQVMIIDEALIGKEIENQVVVSADNAEEVEDDEKVTVEEPEEETTEPSGEEETDEEPEPEPEPDEEPESEPEPEPEPEPAPTPKPEKSSYMKSVQTGDVGKWILPLLLSVLSCAAVIRYGMILLRKSKA